MMMKKEFVKPLLYDGKGDLSKRWYVYYYVGGIRKKIYKPINRYSTILERTKAAQKIIDEILLKERLAFRSNTRKKVEKYMISKSNFWRPKTYAGHQSKVSIFFNWLGFDEFGNEALRDFFIHLMETRNRTTYNNYRIVLKQVFTEALRLNAHESEELFLGIKSVKSYPKPPTTFSMSMVPKLKAKILERRPNLWMVCLLQYYCFIRPGEIRHLKVSDVILDENKILIDGTVSKNNKQRSPVIPPAFIEDLETELEGRALNEYLCPSSRGNDKMASANCYAYWHRSILTEIGLSTDRYKLYSWKPTGMLHAKKNGASMKFMKEQAGHASIDQTDSYLRSVGWRDDDNSAVHFPKI